MNFLEAAKTIEREGYKQYLDLAEKTPVREIRGIFSFLATEEMKHLAIFETLDKNENLPFVEDSKIADYATTTFRELSEQFRHAGIPAIDYEDVYSNALELEERSIEFYTNALKEAVFDNPGKQSVLVAIIEQEQLHSRLLCSILELLRHPGEWLENAEWYHLEPY